MRNECGRDARAPNVPKGWHSRGYIPHFDEPNLIQAITFRLYDSLPEHVIAQWKEELGITTKTPIDDKCKTMLQERISAYEDAGYGECYLQNRKIAKIVQDALLYFDGTRYKLLDWCIMPNHVHVLIATNSRESLSYIVHSWKSFTAKKANAVLGRTGSFWMPDYYDRFIRNEEHFAAVSAYIRENPVKCGLVKDVEEWEWSSGNTGALGARASRPQKNECENECGRDARAPSD